MSAIERRGGIPANHNNLLSPEEQGAVDTIEGSLRKIVPPEIFDQAAEIVTLHLDQYGPEVLNFARRGPEPKLNNEQKKKVARLYSKDKNKTTDELAEQFEVSATTVWKTLVELGIERRRGHMPKGKEVRKLPNKYLFDRYAEGDSLSKLADEFLVNKETIRRRLAKRGIRIRTRGEQNAIRGSRK